MTIDQLHAAFALSGHDANAKSSLAAKLVLVDGYKGVDAAKECEVATGTVSKVVKRIKQVVALANAYAEASQG